MTKADLTVTSAALIEAGKNWPGARCCESEPNGLLQRLANSHATFMRDAMRQGHQGFQSRFDEVHRELGLFAAEIAAESWEWQRNAPLVEVGKEMFRCWQQSAGHWKVASKVHRYVGANMALGKNGIWYACILVAD